MRIRNPFLAAFAVLILAAGYLGLAPNQLPSYKQSDKVLHVVTFFLLTLCFYWILETSRKRVIHITLLVCTAGLGLGSEVVQGLLPNGRDFDPFDIVANVVGSGAALFLCSWYHRRMLERKRKNKHYDIVPGDDLDDHDIELGEGAGITHEHETGVVTTEGPTVTEQLDNWDENAEDWDEDEPALADGPDAGDAKVPVPATEDGTKKRDD